MFPGTKKTGGNIIAKENSPPVLGAGTISFDMESVERTVCRNIGSGINPRRLHCASELANKISHQPLPEIHEGS